MRWSYQLRKKWTQLTYWAQPYCILTLLDSRVSMHVNTVSSEPYLSPICRNSFHINEISVFSTLVNFETFVSILKLNCQFWALLEPNLSIKLCYRRKFSFWYTGQLWSFVSILNPKLSLLKLILTKSVDRVGRLHTSLV